MDPLLLRLVEKRLAGVPLPVITLYFDGMLVIGYLHPDDTFVDDAHEWWAAGGHGELADELDLGGVAGDSRYVTITKATVLLPPLQTLEIPNLRVDLERVTGWAVRTEPPADDEDVAESPLPEGI